MVQFRVLVSQSKLMTIPPRIVRSALRQSGERRRNGFKSDDSPGESVPAQRGSVVPVIAADGRRPR